MKAESDPGDTGDQLSKSKSKILQIFLKEVENLRANYLEMQESEISEPTKKEAVLASLQALKLSSAKKSVGLLNPDDLFIDILFQYVSELGVAIDNIERAYINKEEADIGEPTKKEAVLHPLNILRTDINEAVEALQ